LEPPEKDGQDAGVAPWGLKWSMKIAQGPTFPPGVTCYVDLTGFLHRLAYMHGPHGLNPQQVTSRITGEPTWGIVGTFNQLHTLAKQRPVHIIAFADSPQDGFRAELLPDYKRKSGSPYLGRQLERLAQCLPHLGIAVVGAHNEFPGMEAEDLIARAVKSVHEPAVVVSYDKDLLQLVGENVNHFNPYKKHLVTPASISAYLKQEFLPTEANLTGHDMAVFLACTGDESDGVRPIGGIGPVTLGHYYEKLPGGLSNPEKIDALRAIDLEAKKNAGKVADWTQALLNLQATDLDTERQRGIDLGTIPEPRTNREAFRQVLEDLTMQSFLKDYDRWFAPFEALRQPSLAMA
jgi:5'-3' exonuclease